MSIRMTLMPVLATGLLAAVPAMAQTASPPANATPATASAPAPANARRDVMVERRISELHSKLKITPAEQKPFDDFAQAMRDNASHMDDIATQRQAAAATATAVDQMKSYSAMAQAHADEVSHLIGPFSTLYDALSPEQKKMADQSFRQFSASQGNPRAATRS